MHPRARRMVREVGTAFAVLAIYVLTLLLPMHQAAGLQRDLAKLGYETVGGWSLCEDFASTSKGGDQPEPTAVKCPAAGIGKYEFAALLPPALTIAPPIVTDQIQRVQPVAPAPTSPPDHFGQSRAPPASV